MAEKRLRVLVDMDQVIADFEGYFLSQFRSKYPNDPFVPLEERNTFYLGDQYDGMSDDMHDKVRSIYHAEGFFRDLPEIEGALDALKEMSEMKGVDVFICSSPLFDYTYSPKEKIQWIDEHLGKDWIGKIILARDKTLVNGHILIDDRVDIKGACTDPTWQHVLFTACHNKNIKVKGKKRLENWTDGSWKTLIEDFQKRL